tara:strand:- start:81755 stop:83245 length:1491 start_codon:yes stop_codon:yes gene_type:complete
MKNKKLINNIYENWNNLSTMNIEDEVNIFSFEKVLKHKEANEKQVYIKEIDLNYKAILIYNKPNEEYVISIKNNKGLIYLFSNKEEGFSILKDEEEIQKNILFKPYYENTNVVMDTEDKWLINEVYLKEVDLIKFKEKEFALNKVNKEIKDQNEQLDLTFEKEQDVELKRNYKFNEKIELLTGICIDNGNHKSYALSNKLFMNINFNEEHTAFEKVLLLSILKTQNFKEIESDVFTVLDLFFDIEKEQKNLTLMVIGEDKFLKENELVTEIRKKDKNLLDQIKNNKNKYANIYIEEKENEFDIIAFDYNKNEYRVTNDINVINSIFFIEMTEEMLNLLPQGKIFVNQKSLLDNKLYFSKVKVEDKNLANKYLGFNNEQLKVDSKELLLKNKTVKILNHINIESENNSVLKKHNVILDNLEDFINGYLKNPDLYYTENVENKTQEVQKEFLEMIFILQEYYIKDISNLSREEDSWSKKRKLKKLKSDINSITKKFTR